MAAMITAWILLKKPDGSMALNGALAGLVSITAPCDGVSPVGALVIGLIGGVLVVLSVLFIDRTLKIDDPVGAVSVHGDCGSWGTCRRGCSIWKPPFSAATRSVVVKASASCGVRVGFGSNASVGTSARRRLRHAEEK